MDRRESRAAAPEVRTTPDSPTKTTADLAAAGMQHLRAGRYLEGQSCCQQALAIDPDHADTLHLMGLLSLHTAQTDHAVEWISRAVRRDPRAEYLYSLGTALRHQKRFEEAVNVFDKAVQLKPDSAQLWKALGEVLVDLERSTEAVLSFRHALKLQPDHFDAANQCGMLLHKIGRLEEAHSYFELCKKLQPDHATALYLHGQSLIGLRRFEEALIDGLKAHELDPANHVVCNNIGVSYQSLGRDGEALPWFDRALALQPNSVEVLMNRAVSLSQIHRFAEAFADYAKVKALQPCNLWADWNLSLLHMLTGNFVAGWAGREVRRNIPSLSGGYPELTEPMWLGQTSIEGKTVLIGADEGLGDAIQFARYVPDVAARGARVILLVHDALFSLLSGLPGVAQCIPRSAAAGGLPPFDVHCPLGSLPLAFGTTLNSIPADTTYLPRPPDARVKAWQERLGPRDRLRVGLVWSGNPDHKNDLNRSSSLRTFLGLLDVGASFVSLQKEPRPDDKAVLGQRSDIIDLSADLTDFAETATLLSCLDVVVTVDTSVAHLAGALGRPTWILLPYTPDFRWLLDRDDSPWYPTARLFRQGASRDYTEVIGRVRTELAALASEKRG